MLQAMAPPPAENERRWDCFPPITGTSIALRCSSVRGVARRRPGGRGRAASRPVPKRAGQSLALVRLRDGVEVPLTLSLTADSDPDWKPDGTAVVFTRMGATADVRYTASVEVVDVRSRA